MYGHNDTKPTVFRGRLTIASVVPLLSLVFALGGCAIGPNFATPKASVQKQWGEGGDRRVATQAAGEGHWWRAFDDPTLDELIERAYQQNLPLQIAGLRILEARAQLGIAVGLQYPQIQGASGSVTAEGLSGNAPNFALLDRHHWDYQLGFDAAWELDLWGRFRRGVEADTANLRASAADYDDALVSLTAEVARTYTVIRTSEVLIQLARDNTRLQEEGLRIAESRFRNGATSELDVTQARTLLETTRASVPRLQTSLRQAENALSTLLGQPPGAVRELLEGPKDIPAAPADVAVGVPAELLRRRPDIRRAELNAAAQCARIGIAKTDLYPSFSLLGTIGWQTSSGGGIPSGRADFHNLFDNRSLFYSFGPSVRWPILNYGRLTNQVRVQDARFQQLVVNYQNTVLDAAREVEDALIAFLNAQDSAVFQQNAVDAAKRSVELSMSQYQDGAVDYERVLDSQRSLLEQQNSLANTRSSIATNLIALSKALGGGWEVRQGQPVVTQSTQTEMEQRTDWGRLLPGPQVPETLDPPPPARDIPVVQKPYW